MLKENSRIIVHFVGKGLAKCKPINHYHLDVVAIMSYQICRRSSDVKFSIVRYDMAPGHGLSSAASLADTSLWVWSGIAQTRHVRHFTDVLVGGNA